MQVCFFLRTANGDVVYRASPTAPAVGELEWPNLDVLLPDFSLLKNETFFMCFSYGNGRTPWFMCELTYSAFVFAWTRGRPAETALQFPASPFPFRRKTSGSSTAGVHVMRHPDALVTVSFQGYMVSDPPGSLRASVFSITNVRCTAPPQHVLDAERQHKVVCLANPATPCGVALYLGRAQRIRTSDTGRDRTYEWRGLSNSPFAGVSVWREEDNALRRETHQDLVRLRVEQPYSARRFDIAGTAMSTHFVPDNDDYSNTAIGPLPIVCGGDGGGVTFKFFNLGQDNARAACGNAVEVTVRLKDFPAAPPPLLLTRSSYKRQSIRRNLATTLLPQPPHVTCATKINKDVCIEIDGIRCDGDDDDASVSIVAVRLIVTNYHFALKFLPVDPPMSA